MAHFIEKLRTRFPRLQQVAFTECDKDEYTVEATPAGTVETVYFYERSDFENAVTALAYKLEPRPIPSSMGAIFINGLLDVEALEKVAMVILSRGGYSGISCEFLKGAYEKHFIHDDHGRVTLAEDLRGLAEDALRTTDAIVQDLTEESWYGLSLIIRKYHELAHFVQRKMFPENKDALKDEIKADLVGIIEAFGTYDAFLARLFLGIEDSVYRKGGRLENYIDKPEDLTKICEEAGAYIMKMEAFLAEYDSGCGERECSEGQIDQSPCGEGRCGEGECSEGEHCEGQGNAGQCNEGQNNDDQCNGGQRHTSKAVRRYPNGSGFDILMEIEKRELLNWS